MKEPFIKYRGEDLYLSISNYQNNGRLYMGLETADEDYYADITINLSDIPEIGDMAVFLNGDISTELKKALRDADLISNPIQQMPYNYGMYDIVFVNRNKLKEYDEKSYKQFEEYYNKKHNFKNNKEEMER